MSFLWRNNTGSTEDSNSLNCKICIEKQKRLTDYELFFNQINQTLKQKETEMEELNKHAEETDLNLQTQLAFREKLIEQIEQVKQIYASEKKQWLEDRSIWLSTRKYFEEESMNWEVERSNWEVQKSNYDEAISQYKMEKQAFKNLSKEMEVKMTKLTEAVKEWENKFEDYKVRSQKAEQVNIQSVKDLAEKRYKSRESELLKKIDAMTSETKQNETSMISQLNEFWENKLKTREQELIEKFELLKTNMKEREEIAIETIRDLYAERLEAREKELLERLEQLEEELIKKQEEWKEKEEHYEYRQQSMEDNEKEYEFKLQEMKYDTISEMERIMEVYETREQEKEKRIQELNESFDNEYVRLRDLMKLKDAEFESEKDNIEKVLKQEIERLKQENKELEAEKYEAEKKRMELFLDNRGLVADNEWLEMEWKEQCEELNQYREETDNLRTTLVQTQQDYEFLKSEYHINQKALEQTIANIANQQNRGTQTISDEPIPTEDTMTQNDDGELIDSGLRQRKVKKKKTLKKVDGGQTSFVHPPVVENMSKYDEKKILNLQQI